MIVPGVGARQVDRLRGGAVRRRNLAETAARARLIIAARHTPRPSPISTPSSTAACSDCRPRAPAPTGTRAGRRPPPSGDGVLARTSAARRRRPCRRRRRAAMACLPFSRLRRPRHPSLHGPSVSSPPKQWVGEEARGGDARAPRRRQKRTPPPPQPPRTRFGRRLRHAERSSWRGIARPPARPPAPLLACRRAAAVGSRRRPPITTTSLQAHGGAGGRAGRRAGGTAMSRQQGRVSNASAERRAGVAGRVVGGAGRGSA